MPTPRTRARNRALIEAAYQIGVEDRGKEPRLLIWSEIEKRTGDRVPSARTRLPVLISNAYTNGRTGTDWPTTDPKLT